MSEKLSIGHSPDPDDAFMFCALSNGAVKIRGTTRSTTSSRTSRR